MQTSSISVQWLVSGLVVIVSSWYPAQIETTQLSHLWAGLKKSCRLLTVLLFLGGSRVGVSALKSAAIAGQSADTLSLEPFSSSKTLWVYITISGKAAPSANQYWPLHFGWICLRAYPGDTKVALRPRLSPWLTVHSGRTKLFAEVFKLIIMHNKYQWTVLMMPDRSTDRFQQNPFKAALERRDLSCTYLAHHELQSVRIIVVIITIITISSIVIIILRAPLMLLWGSALPLYMRSLKVQHFMLKNKPKSCMPWCCICVAITFTIRVMLRCRWETAGRCAWCWLEEVLWAEWNCSGLQLDGILLKGQPDMYCDDKCRSWHEQTMSLACCGI